MKPLTLTTEITHGHLFCGLGGDAKGFKQVEARTGNTQAKFTGLGGIDLDPASIKDFGKLAEVPATVMDLFSREQYIDFHGRSPPLSKSRSKTSKYEALSMMAKEGNAAVS